VSGRHLPTLLTYLAAAFLLAACGSGTPERQYSGPGPRYKVGDPYQINGVWYYPREDYNYKETGVASWYGEAFHGKQTANGEIFDRTEVSAAHRTLPKIGRASCRERVS
jgi:rare lipoprotein A